MKPASSIQFLRHDEIDNVRWDDCVIKAKNSLIYAHSFYLDAMSPNWSALTNNDYDWVLPITSNKKLGVSYLYQPAFVQQLGVFYKDDFTIPWQEITEFLKDRFRFWEINWNYACDGMEDDSAVQLKVATNFILNLSNSHYDIASAYHNDLKKNLKHAARFALHYQSVLDYEKGIDLYIEHYSNRMPHVTQTHYEAFKKACAKAYKLDMLVCREVVDNNNNLLAISLLLKDSKRLYNLMNTTTEEGRNYEANHMLIDSLIAEFAKSDLLLDFEGSDLAGVKAFYKNFGAVNQPYFKLKYNNLPWPLQWLKA